MNSTKVFISFLLPAFILISTGCKKSDQTVKMGQAATPACDDPIHLFTESVDSTYIVMLRNADNQSGSTQTLGEATTSVNNILSQIGRAHV